MQETGFDPWVGKIPWRRKQLPTPVFWAGDFHGLYSPWGRQESDTTERLSLSLFSCLFASTVLSCCCCLVAQPCLTLSTPWTVTHQAPLSVDFPRQEYWSGLPIFLQGSFLTQGLNTFSCIAGRFFTAEPPGKPSKVYSWANILETSTSPSKLFYHHSQMLDWFVFKI